MIIPKVTQDELAWFSSHGISSGATCSERLRNVAAHIKPDGSSTKAIEVILDAANRLEGFESQHGRFAIFVQVCEIED